MVAMQARTRRSQTTTVEFLRAQWVTFVSALVLFLAVEAALQAPARPVASVGSARTIGLVVAGFGFGVLVAARFVERPLPCSADALVGAYRTRFFLRVAFANSGALVGFVLSFTTGRWWVYAFGLAPPLVGQVTPPPPRRRWRV